MTLSNALLDDLIQATQNATSASTIYQSCRDKFPPGNETRSKAWRNWQNAQNEVTRTFNAWMQALNLETQDRGIRK